MFLTVKLHEAQSPRSGRKQISKSFLIKDKELIPVDESGSPIGQQATHVREIFGQVNGPVPFIISSRPGGTRPKGQTDIFPREG